jgi:hypothetical protein
VELALTGVAYAEANWGRWIARCIRPYCTNAVGLMPGQQLFICEGGPDACGQTADVMWPADPDAIETVLAMRPVRRTQNWLPGETVEDLLAENAAHDCLPPEWLALSEAAGRLVLARTVAGRVVGGVLHQELEAAAERREIGA